LLICAFLGFVTTVSLAWWCALHITPQPTPRGPSMGVGYIERQDWRWWFIGDQDFGSTQIVWTPWPLSAGVIVAPSMPDNVQLIPYWSAYARLKPEQPMPWESSPYQIDFVEDARGWPLKAFRSWRKTHSHGGVRPNVSRSYRFEYIREPVERWGWYELPAWMNRFHLSGAVPLAPVWPGLFADSAAFGAGWFILLLGPGMVKRMIRRRGGRCPACGYNLRGELALGCSECGWGRALPRA